MKLERKARGDNVKFSKDDWILSLGLLFIPVAFVSIFSYILSSPHRQDSYLAEKREAMLQSIESETQLEEDWIYLDRLFQKHLEDSLSLRDSLRDGKFSYMDLFNDWKENAEIVNARSEFFLYDIRNQYLEYNPSFRDSLSNGTASYGDLDERCMDYLEHLNDGVNFNRGR
jgi:hypothetical protein